MDRGEEMTQKILIRRGIKANLPTLAVGEFALCTDTKEVFIGTTSGNKLLGSNVTGLIDDLYFIELDRWNIYNDGTHPLETENGINNALLWAKSNGYSGAYLKEGTYLIESTYYVDPIKKTGGAGIGSPYPASNRPGGERGIKPPSNFTFEMHKDCIIKMNPNTAHNSVCISVVDKENIVIKGGQIIGDKDHHLYTYYEGFGMGGHGYGLVIERSTNIKVYDSTFSNHVGDGVLLTGSMDFYRMNRDIYMKNVVCDSNGRQGMSIIVGDNLLFEDCTYSRTSGTSPEYGVDIESGSYSCTNIIFRRCLFTGNAKGGFVNADSTKPVLEDCIFKQNMGFHPAYGAEVRRCKFTDDDGVEYRKKYTNLLTPNTTYNIGDRARLDFSLTSEGYTCIKGGTTGSDVSQMVRKNNYPPADVQSSMLGIIYTYGDTEWVHSDNYNTYGGSGVNPSYQPYSLNLPVNVRANNTSYVIGNQVRLTNGTALLCTVAGVSGNADPDTSNKFLGDTLTDGGVKWKITDNIFPTSVRKRSTSYSEGDIVLWEDGTLWECVQSGTTAANDLSLSDLPIGSILIAHASSSRIQKVAYDPIAPRWEPFKNKLLNDKVNIDNTTWQFISKKPYSIEFGLYSTGDREPSVTDILRETLLNDGSVIWKKAITGNFVPVGKSIFEDNVFDNTSLTITTPIIISSGNKITNGDYNISGFDVYSNNNTIINTKTKTSTPSKNVTYLLNSGKCTGDIIKNSLVTVTVRYDYQTPRKRVVENIFLEDSTINTSTVLYNSSLILDNLSYSSSQLGSSILMNGGRIVAYIPSNQRLFNPWNRNLILKNVNVDLSLEDGASMFASYTRSGYFTLVEGCTFMVTPLAPHVPLISIGYTDANVKLKNNRFFNNDTNKAIDINLPTGDTVNTINQYNFYDINYYSTDINCIGNTGGNRCRTTIESPTIPVIGEYALGTRVRNSLPTIGSPKSWVVTSAGLVFSSTRANSTTYNVGDFVKWSSGNNIYECVQTGTTAPTSPTAGAGIVTDGTVQWSYRGNIAATFTSEGNL